MSTHERTPEPRVGEEDSEVTRAARRKLNLPRPTSPPGRLSALNLPPRSEVSEVSEGIYTSDSAAMYSSEGMLPNPDMLLHTDASEVDLEELAFSWANDPLLGVELLGGRYVIESVIGEGGYGVVYRAVQRTTGQHVAVKVLRRDKLSEHDNITIELARFEREMKLIGQLNHPNIVRLIDYGRLNADNLFTILEYIDGVPLSDLLHEEGALSPYEARSLMLQVLEALGAAHELGIVYRDLKPHNLMITTSGVRRSVKLLDFGISGLIEDARDSDYENLTQEGVINGTPAYMAPEQLHGWTLTPQSDIYSWGLVFLEMLMGRKAVQGASYVDVLAQQISNSPIEIPDEILTLPIGSVLERAVAKPLEVRYQDVREALYDLEECTLSQSEVLPWTGAPALSRLQSSLNRRQQRSVALGAVPRNARPTAPPALAHHAEAPPQGALEEPDASDRTLRSADLEALGLPHLADDAIGDVIDEMMGSVWTTPSPEALAEHDADEWDLEEIPHPLDWTPPAPATRSIAPPEPTLDLTAELAAVARAHGVPLEQDAPETPPARPPSRSGVMAVAAMAIVAVLGVGAWWSSQDRNAKPEPSAPTTPTTHAARPSAPPPVTSVKTVAPEAPARANTAPDRPLNETIGKSPTETTGEAATAPKTPPTPASADGQTTGAGAARAAEQPADKPAERPAPRTASLQIVVFPEEARIELDGQMLGRGAVKLVMPDDGSVHTLTITADGHKPYTQRFIGALEIKELRLEADQEQPRRRRRTRRRRPTSDARATTRTTRDTRVSVPGLKNPWETP